MQGIAHVPDGVTLRPIHRNIRKVWRWSAIGGSLVTAAILGPAVAGLFLGMQKPWWIGALCGVTLALVLCVRSLVLIDRQYRAWGYALTDRELIVQWGIYWRTARYIPRDAIQHVDVNQGPIDRRNGIAQVQVYTAATGTAVVTIPGLAEADANDLRGRLLPQFELGS